MKKHSVLNKITVIIVAGSFIGAVFVGVMVFVLLSPYDSLALQKAIISTFVIQLVFFIPIYLIRMLIDKMIVSRLNAISKAMDEISMGNLDYEIKVEKSGDELEQLAEAFERMRLSMKTIMEKLEKGEL